jgi:competence ComEA-like helix-hairpin-helix protein
MSETRPLFRQSQPGNAKGSTVVIRASSFASQLSSQLFAPNAQAQLAAATISIPRDRVLPQLTSGRVVITVEEIVSLLPATLLRQPLPPGLDQQTVNLPLADVVAAIPAEMLAVQPETTLDINSPELSNLPPLFDESLLQEPGIPEEPVPVESVLDPEAIEIVPVTQPESLPASAAERPAGTTKPVPTAITETSKDNLPSQIAIRLRSLVAGMPDRLFAAPRAELWRLANPESHVAIPFAPIQSQLQSARVRLPIETVIASMPPALFVSPLPQFSGETVVVPLDEIIPQLPSHAFTTLFRTPQTSSIDLDASDIPTPFHEKNEPATVEEPVAAVEEVTAETLAAEPVAAATVEPEPSTALSADDFADEHFTIFAEKSAAPVAPAEPAVPPTPVMPATPQPEPKIEFMPEPTPVSPPAPTTVPEPVAQELELPAEPVIEPVEVDEPEPLAAELPPEEPVTSPSPERVAAEDRKFLVNLNRCTVEELVRIQGIGPALARRIVAAREARGHFSSLEELRSVPGIGRKTYRALVGKEPRVLNRLLGVEHDQELSLQEVVRQIGVLPGVSGCILAMSDGLLLTGQLPDHLDSNAVSVFAPQLFKKVGRYTREIQVGQIRRMTIFTDRHPLSIFQAGDIYLVVVHDPQRYSKALLRRCERIGQEIAALCRQRAVV